MAKPPNLTTPDECWRALLRLRGLYGQGDRTEEQFWDEAEAIVDVAHTLIRRAGEEE